MGSVARPTAAPQPEDTSGGGGSLVNRREGGRRVSPAALACACGLGPLLALDDAYLLAVQQRDEMLARHLSALAGGPDDGVQVDACGCLRLGRRVEAQTESLQGAEHKAQFRARLALLKRDDPLAADARPAGQGGLVELQGASAVAHGGSEVAGCPDGHVQRLCHRTWTISRVSVRVTMENVTERGHV